MAMFDINKTLGQTGDSLKQLSALNPLTIHKKGRKTKAIFALLIVCFFWGTTWIASRQGVLYMPALQLAGIRQFLGGICYVIFYIIRGEKWPDKKQWQTIIILSILNFSLGNGLTTWGVKYISAGLGSIIGATFPLWLVVINMFASKAKIPLKAIAGFFIGFAGICVIFYEHLNDFLNIEFSYGIILAFVGTLAWAFGTLYTKKHAQSFNPYFSLGLQMSISGIGLLGISSVTGNMIMFSAIPWQSWLSIGYLVAFGSVFSFIAYLYALQNLTAEQTSVYAYINPVVAVLFSWLLFDERLTVYIAAGGLITLGGVYLINKSYKTPPSTPPEPEMV
ncbi:MAG: EamA family transporter [Chitinophagaceae bacterium]